METKKTNEFAKVKQLKDRGQKWKPGSLAAEGLDWAAKLDGFFCLLRRKMHLR